MAKKKAVQWKNAKRKVSTSFEASVSEREEVTDENAGKPLDSETLLATTHTEEPASEEASVDEEAPAAE